MSIVSMYIIIFVVLVILMFIFKRFIKTDYNFYTIMVAILAILITSLFTTIQIQEQNNQNFIDNRPSVFISGWGNPTFKSYPDHITITMLLRNVGKLPAKIVLITPSVVIGNTEILIKALDNDKPIVLFPEQENTFIDFPITNELALKILKNNNFILKMNISYYSLTDKKGVNKLYYYTEYGFFINNSKIESFYSNDTNSKEEVNQSSGFSFGDPILLRTDAG